MRQRLGRGELEHAVMEALWEAPGPRTPREVLVVVGAERDLAYTTVMTILVRLWKKGMVTREDRGRTFAYRPALSRDEFVSARMHNALIAAADPAAALGHFVQHLDPAERGVLRRMLRRGS